MTYQQRYDLLNYNYGTGTKLGEGQLVTQILKDPKYVQKCYNTTKGVNREASQWSKNRGEAKNIHGNQDTKTELRQSVQVADTTKMILYVYIKNNGGIPVKSDKT